MYILTGSRQMELQQSITQSLAGRSAMVDLLPLSLEELAAAGIPLPLPDFEAFYSQLPFRPTSAQRRAVSEAAADLASGRQMNRLLQGDVGSGKTLAAAALIWQCARAGHLSLLMAPTQILAQQHYQTLTAFLSPMGLRIGLLTGTVKAAERKSLQKKLDEKNQENHAYTHNRVGKTFKNYFTYI